MATVDSAEWANARSTRIQGVGVIYHDTVMCSDCRTLRDDTVEWKKQYDAALSRVIELKAARDAVVFAADAKKPPQTPPHDPAARKLDPSAYDSARRDLRALWEGWANAKSSAMNMPSAALAEAMKTLRWLIRIKADGKTNRAAEIKEIYETCGAY
jgi:hypothetical protein